MAGFKGTSAACSGSWEPGLRVARYRQAVGSDPLPDLGERLRVAWGDPARRRTVRWEIILVIGHKPAVRSGKSEVEDD